MAALRNPFHSPSTHAAFHPSRLEHSTFCAVRSRHVPSHRTCTMICMVGVWSCALDAPWRSVAQGHECFSLVHSVLHFFIVCLTIQLNIVLVFCRIQRIVALTLFFSAIIQSRSYGFGSLGPVTLTPLAVKKLWERCCAGFRHFRN